MGLGHAGMTNGNSGLPRCDDRGGWDAYTGSLHGPWGSDPSHAPIPKQLMWHAHRELRADVDALLTPLQGRVTQAEQSIQAANTSIANKEANIHMSISNLQAQITAEVGMRSTDVSTLQNRATNLETRMANAENTHGADNLAIRTLLGTTLTNMQNLFGEVVSRMDHIEKRMDGLEKEVKDLKK